MADAVALIASKVGAVISHNYYSFVQVDVVISGDKNSYVTCLATGDYNQLAAGRPIGTSPLAHLRPYVYT